MNHKEAREAFERYIDAGGVSLRSMTPEAGIRRMIGFFEDVPVEDCDSERDGDMLLFQWGTYDWGGGANFSVNITRQFIAGEGEDDDIFQLGLTFKWPPSEDFAALGSGNRWCRIRADLPLFWIYLRGNLVFQTMADRRPQEVEIRYEQAG